MDNSRICLVWFPDPSCVGGGLGTKLEFVTVCCSMSVVSNTSCSHFFGQWSYWGYIHAFTKLRAGVMRWISHAYECRLCMDFTWSELNYSTWFVLSVSLPLSVMIHSCHATVHFVPRVSFTPTLRSGSSPSQTRQRAGYIACTKGPHEIFKYAHL